MSLSNCVRPPAIIGLITGLGFFGGFLVGVGRTRCAPTGFGGVFWGFQEKYVGVNCDRL
ncbi:hypothetical protein O53_2558 [Microcystis aeruginosa TAIHU98]|uniref:Uncharacterized protein n=1 Tax=Microcystis aeruginosa TAIHU98 TaxID=1134457 RepID=L7E4F2_MICAE|nr:hypothetical protein O53_2558 [Microcystis aeruginosa TAIHU98]